MQTVPEPPSELVELMSRPFADQKAFAFRRHKWLEWLAEIPGAVEAINNLPDRVDRAMIRRAFSTLERDNVEGAFTAAMIWGYGKDNNGPYRTLRVLSNEFEHGNTLSDEVAQKLRHSIAVSRSEGGAAGYYYLNNEGGIKHLGPSFGTKWLYYATASGPQGAQGAAPILDKLVIKWFSDIDVKLREYRTLDYQCYINIVTQWGSEYELTAVDVEERIFRLIRDDGA